MTEIQRGVVCHDQTSKRGYNWLGTPVFICPHANEIGGISVHFD